MSNLIYPNIEILKPNYILKNDQYSLTSSFLNSDSINPGNIEWISYFTALIDPGVLNPYSQFPLDAVPTTNCYSNSKGRLTNGWYNPTIEGQKIAIYETFVFKEIFAKAALINLVSRRGNYPNNFVIQISAMKKRETGNVWYPFSGILNPQASIAAYYRDSNNLSDAIKINTAKNRGVECANLTSVPLKTILSTPPNPTEYFSAKSLLLIFKENNIDSYWIPRNDYSTVFNLLKNETEIMPININELLLRMAFYYMDVSEIGLSKFQPLIYSKPTSEKFLINLGFYKGKIINSSDICEYYAPFRQGTDFAKDYYFTTIDEGIKNTARELLSLSFSPYKEMAGLYFKECFIANTVWNDSQKISELATKLYDQLVNHRFYIALKINGVWQGNSAIPYPANTQLPTFAVFAPYFPSIDTLKWSSTRLFYKDCFVDFYFKDLSTTRPEIESKLKGAGNLLVEEIKICSSNLLPSYSQTQSGSKYLFYYLATDLIGFLTMNSVFGRQVTVREDLLTEEPIPYYNISISERTPLPYIESCDLSFGDPQEATVTLPREIIDLASSNKNILLDPFVGGTSLSHLTDKDVFLGSSLKLNKEIKINFKESIYKGIITDISTSNENVTLSIYPENEKLNKALFYPYPVQTYLKNTPIKRVIKDLFYLSGINSYIDNFFTIDYEWALLNDVSFFQTTFEEAVNKILEIVGAKLILSSEGLLKLVPRIWFTPLFLTGLSLPLNITAATALLASQKIPVVTSQECEIRITNEYLRNFITFQFEDQTFYITFKETNLLSSPLYAFQDSEIMNLIHDNGLLNIAKTGLAFEGMTEQDKNFYILSLIGLLLSESLSINATIDGYLKIEPYQLINLRNEQMGLNLICNVENVTYSYPEIKTTLQLKSLFTTTYGGRPPIILYKGMAV